MIPLTVPNLCGNESAYLKQCVDSNFVSTIGPFVTRFEEMVSHHSAFPHAVATSSGTTGLHAALVAVGVGRDDLVMLPSLTFIASANAIAHCGAAPWLVDIDPRSWTLDPEAVAEALESETEMRGPERVHRESGRRVAAVMPVHALGLPADMDRLVDLARHYGLRVVADGAAALGARYRGRPIGTTGADLTVFSFNGNKTVTAGGGGAVAGSDPPLCDLVRHLTTTARTADGYSHDRVGFNYRMTNVQAAVGCAQLEQLEAFVRAKRRIARAYTEALTELDGVGAFPDPEWAESACWLSGVTVDARDVDRLIAALRERGIEARRFWKPIHLQAPYRDAPRRSTAVCDELWRRILTLPCSTSLTARDQDSVIAVLRSCLR